MPSLSNEVLRMSASDLRKWLAVGSGVGVEIGREDLTVTVVRVRPNGVRVLGSLNISRFREQPAAEWGAVYNAFLKKSGASHLTATVLLPREDVTVRQVALPGVADRDVPAALRYQIESLHPYSDAEVVYDWARVGRTPTILVGITRRDVLERYIALFAEAGLRVSSFTFAAAAMYSAVRLYAPPKEGFFALSPHADDADDLPGFEVYGESGGRPLFSARLEMPESRARALALAELRLEPDTEAAGLDAILPKPAAAPEGENLSRGALPYATALAGACPRLAMRLNLLPEAQRAARSRWIYVPTIALASLMLLAVGAVAASGSYENRRYVGVLEQEIRRVEPQAKKAAALERDIAVLRNRAQSLDNFRLRSKEDMDALNDVTRVLAPPTWLNGLQLTRTQLSITGETDQSTPLLKALDGTRQFKRSEFTVPMARTPQGESFSIRSAREGVLP
jgi:Tfp pilus assembly protein PilN